jgi:dihydrofolate synthase / folylpolyglutamate synthase
MLEAQGYRVHAYTSPHLVRFNERIRIAGTVITDAALAPLLNEVLDAGADLGPSFFEATTAAAFLAFARAPADACLIEVGLGGRLDATNVIERPLVCGIASLGIDHEAFLLAPETGVPEMPPLERIAFEKAGIAKRGVPLVTLDYAPAVAARIAACANDKGAILAMRGQHWVSVAIGRGFAVSDRQGKLYANPPALHGAHQMDNAALAIAMLHQQPLLPVRDAAIQRGLASTRWPARMQPLADGPITRLVSGRDVWLDGGHNPDAGAAIARALPPAGSVDVIIGMLANKDVSGFIAPFASRIRTLRAVPIPGHAHHAPDVLAAVARQANLQSDAQPAADVAAALAALPGGKNPILICGSLYLAGEVLRLNRQLPD